ncbi:MAG: Hpt domain-containing protein [Anaerolineae bacterium]
MEFASQEERAEYVRLFCEEAGEQLRILGEGLLALRRSPEKRELAYPPYRAAHTLKGSSGYLGFEQIGSLALGMEQVLKAVSEGRAPYTQASDAALVEAVEALYRLTRQVARDGRDEDPKAAAAVERLRGLIREG